MFHQEAPNYKRGEYTLFSLDDLVPKDHLLRQIDEAIDFSFIYDKVEQTYSHATGRPSLDPVLFVKIPLIQTLFGIRSMRQTIEKSKSKMVGKAFYYALKATFLLETTLFRKQKRQTPENGVFVYILKL